MAAKTPEPVTPPAHTTTPHATAVPVHIDPHADLHARTHETAEAKAAHEAEVKAAKDKEAAAKRQEEAKAALPAGLPCEAVVGDIVRARLHDSPQMVVTNLSANGLDITCDWFDKAGVHHSEVFHKALLVHV